MSPVLLLVAMAFADPTEAAPPTWSPALSASAPVDPVAAMADAVGSKPDNKGGHGRYKSKRAPTALAPDTAPAATATAMTATAAPVPTTPAALTAPEYGPAPAPVATAAPASEPLAAPVATTPLVATAVAPVATPAVAPSVLDTMGATTPALDALPAGTTPPVAGWAWPVLLTGVGLAAAWQLRKRALSALPSTLKVVQRHTLGEKSSLLVVDVEDGQGVSRRLVVGAGPTGLNLIQDLGVVTDAPMALPLPTPVDVALPSGDDLPMATLRPRVDAFAHLLDEVLEERAVALPTTPIEAKPARFFAPEDLAPVVQVPAARPHRRRAHLRGRFAGAPSEWSPNVEAYSPPAAPVALVAAPEPIVEPARRGASALLKSTSAVAAPAKKSGLSALVKHTLPEATAPSLVVLPALPPVEAPVVAAAPVAVVEAPLVATSAPEAPAHNRAVYVSPTMSQPVTRPDRRIVGPPLRDARLTAAPTGPRLKLADPRGRVAEAPIPPVKELVDRLLAQNQEPEKVAVNASAPAPSRADGLKRRFEAIVAREASR